METKKKFNKRAFVSTGMFLTLAGLPFSGLMNHFLGFDLLTAQKHMWMSVHNILGIFFVFFAVWHIVLNWKPLVNSIGKAANVILSREAVYAVTLVLFFLTIAILHAFAAAR
jgi:Domain of unknown function (DUF4405)